MKNDLSQNKHLHAQLIIQKLHLYSEAIDISDLDPSTEIQILYIYSDIQNEFGIIWKFGKFFPIFEYLDYHLHNSCPYNEESLTEFDLQWNFIFDFSDNRHFFLFFPNHYFPKCQSLKNQAFGGIKLQEPFDIYDIWP